MERSKRSVFAGFFVITLLVIILTGVASSVLESSCQAKFETNLPIYPDASLVSKDGKFLQYRQATYYTPASTDNVKDWYNKAIYVALSESVAKTGKSGSVWQGDWDVQAASQGGSTISLSRNCG
ncbi:MAG: hypothetical protein ABI970_19850 [Chloroflexota bacterium]